MAEFTNLGLQTYYGGLGRKERMRLKNFIATKLDMSIYTLQSKFTGYNGSKFSKVELVAIQPIVEGETWRQ